MSTDRETAHAVRSWLDEGVTRLPDRVLDAVLDQVPATPQRRSGWRAWRFSNVTNPVRYAIGAVAVLAVALVGFQFLPSGNVGSQPTVAPTVAATPTAPPVTSAPTLEPRPMPSAGPLAVGRHRFIMEDVPFTLDIAAPGWTSDGVVFLGKGTELSPDGMNFLFWQRDADFVYKDPCAKEEAPPAGPTPADMAAAIAGMPQLEPVSGPTPLTIDGKPAQHVVVRIPDQLDCSGEFWLWGDNSGTWAGSRYATGPGTTYWVWIIDVDGKHIQIDGESFAGAGPEVAAEIRAIVESIRFD